MSETISVRRLFQVVKKRLWLLLLSGVVGGLVVGGITYFVLPAQYSAQAQLIVTLAASET
ncbi:Wzz/FepE/Etk N-terminal domain-containing protein, partial [Enterococcus asini]|uniref:Wzz/FepE/Etk N-terminal domain-containing protein n=1 Tax=Enterococcus asini TaxID=57732 RepID=UPI0026DD5A7C